MFALFNFGLFSPADVKFIFDRLSWSVWTSSAFSSELLPLRPRDFLLRDPHRTNGYPRMKHCSHMSPEAKRYRARSDAN